MGQYKKDGIIKSRNDIVLRVTKVINGEEVKLQVINPTEEMLLVDGWEIYTPAPHKELPLEAKTKFAKLAKRKEVLKHDKSAEVNLFYIGDTAMWLDKETRTGLMLRFQAEQAIGNTDTTLWANGVQYPLPLAVAVQMLYALEVYASACYDNTQRHLAAVDSLSTIEEIQSYDYTTGYPDKLKF